MLPATLSNKQSSVKDFVSGQIAIAKVSISATRFVKLPRKGTVASRSKEPSSVTSKERMSRLCDIYQAQDGLTLYRHVLRAAQHLVMLDERQVNAVSARIELDLRIGYAFTRFLSNNLKPMGPPLTDMTLSYGKYLLCPL
jgi:hypothetical protein